MLELHSRKKYIKSAPKVTLSFKASWQVEHYIRTQSSLRLYSTKLQHLSVYTSSNATVTKSIVCWILWTLSTNHQTKHHVTFFVIIILKYGMLS